MEKPRYKISQSQWTVAGIIGALAAAMLYYRFLNASQLEQTAALFIGLPALIAIIITLTPKSKSPKGMTIKAISIGLFSSGIFLQEGFICILLAAPIFFFVGLVVVMFYEVSKNIFENFLNQKNRLHSLLILPIIALGLEGITPATSFDRLEEITVVRTVPIEASKVEELLSQTPVFEDALPAVLRIGFPTPIATKGSGLNIGDQRIITFGVNNRRSGDLVLEIIERSEGRFLMTANSDSSEIAHWLAWKEINIAWTDLGDGNTQITWTVRYERLLDPAWYFGPMQRYVVEQAVNYLIISLISS